MTRPKLTIGMPTFDDYDGCYFTLQSLRLHHDLSEVELLVVDNKPDSPGSAILKGQIENQFQFGTAGARYIALPDVVGPAGAKQRVFDEATGEAVLCMDSHVLLPPGAIARLLRWYERHPDSLDLLHGPLLYDNLTQISTHFIDQWRGEMWGIWGNAWRRKNPTADGRHKNEDFSVLDVEGRAQLAGLVSGQPVEHQLLGDIPYAGHEQTMLDQNFRPLGTENGDEFEIPGQGMGLFSCRKSAWLGFNPEFRGFGGEEMYIHEKFRQAGRKTLCLGFLKWLHRFNRPAGVKYPLTRWNKVRNYVLGHLELGLPLDRVYEHFVASKLMPQAEWDSLIANPSRDASGGPAVSPDTSRCAPAGDIRNVFQSPAVAHRPPEAPSLEDLYTATKAQSTYMNQHLDKLRELASQCQVVEEVSRYRETTVALFAGKPKVLRSHLFEGSCPDPIHEQLAELAAENGIEEFSREKRPDCQRDENFAIQDCDLLYYKTSDMYQGLAADLKKWATKARRFIAVSDGSYNPKLIEDLRNFAADNSVWFVYYHAAHQFGLTVLGCQESDRPAEPIHAWPIGRGPGTELKKILADLGVNPSPSCDCNGKARAMDTWGVSGCRENFETIVGWMRDGQERWGWKEKITIAAKAVASGLAFQLNWLDPFPGLIEESIRRAEANEPTTAKEAA